MKARPDKWTSEAAMCASFVAAAESAGWLVYPETAGHDLVLVATERVAVQSGFEVGDQVAVEAKLVANLEVLAQAIPADRRRYAGDRGADFYAVLVPTMPPGFRDVAAALGILVIRCACDGGQAYHSYNPVQMSDWERAGLLCSAPQPLVLPLRVRMPAGLPSPRKVTPWKVDAVRICLLDRELSRDDFKGTQVSSRTFVDRGWMQVSRREGRVPFWTLVDRPTRPDRMYPEIVAALREEAAGGTP